MDMRTAMRLVIDTTTTEGRRVLHGAAPIQTWTTLDGEVSAVGYVADGHQWLQWPELATFRFDAANGLVTAFPEPRVDAAVIEDTWRRSVLPLALLAHGLEALHASAVETPTGVVAFCGVTGTGKSTLAYALRGRGYPQWADDAVALQVDIPARSFTAVALPYSTRLAPEASQLVGRIAPARSASRSASAPLRAICVLSRLSSDAPSAFTAPRINGSQGLLALLPHVHTFDPSDRPRQRRMLEALLAIVECVPVYAVSFRPGLRSWPDVLDGATSLIAGL